MKFILTICIFIVFSSSAYSSEKNFFNEAKMLYEEEEFDKSKFLFQRNIVFNPRDAKSYLYLAKIYKKEDDKFEEEKNLNTTLLLEPKNEEAMYLLIDIEIKRSNFSKAKQLKSDFKKICKLLCVKLPSIDSRLKEFEKKDAS
tara:strand:+ start:77 stop:505 length:429 start_codon:yes stop_codon:yes gene_type:complete